MNIFRKIALLLLALLLVLTCFSGCATARKSDDIIILFTNDVHGGIDDDIGYAGLAAYKKALSETHTYVTLVDCGDHMQGSYIGSVSKGECIVEIMNEVGYDFAIPGNHEFDFGMAQLARNLQASKAQYLCCNISYSGSGTNALVDTKPYEIVNYGKTKVAFVGVSTPRSITSSTPTHFMEDGVYVYSFAAGDDGTVLYKTVQDSVDACRKAGADYVIVLSHLGVDESDRPYTSLDLIANTADIDVVLDAHSHTELPCRIVADKNGAEVLLSQGGTKLNNIGQLVITEDGFLSVGYITDYAQKDSATEAMIRNVQAQYDEVLGEVVAALDFDLSISDENGVRMIRSRELAIGDLVADAYRIIGGADIGMCNGGGIRADLPAGDITYKDIISVNPYGNALCVVKITGAELLDMLEYFYQYVQADYVLDGRPFGENGSFQQVSGLRFTVHTDIPSSVETDENDMLLSVGETRRVSDVEILKNGTYIPVDPDATYTLASHDYFIKNGGCGMGIILAGHELVIDSSISDYQVLIEYINSLNGDLSGYRSSDGRILIE